MFLRSVMGVAIAFPLMPHTPLLSLATSAQQVPLGHRSQRTPPVQKGQCSPVLRVLEPGSYHFGRVRVLTTLKAVW